MSTDYPIVSPKCILTSHEYNTPYLSAVRKGLEARLAKLPKRFSMSQLLDTWETSVRQACSSKAQQVEKSDKSSSTTESMTGQTSKSSTSSVPNGISTNLISSAAS